MLPARLCPIQYDNWIDSQDLSFETNNLLWLNIFIETNNVLQRRKITFNHKMQ